MIWVSDYGQYVLDDGTLKGAGSFDISVDCWDRATDLAGQQIAGDQDAAAKISIVAAYKVPSIKLCTPRLHTTYRERKVHEIPRQGPVPRRTR